MPASLPSCQAFTVVKLADAGKTYLIWIYYHLSINFLQTSPYMVMLVNQPACQASEQWWNWPTQDIAYQPNGASVSHRNCNFFSFLWAWIILQNTNTESPAKHFVPLLLSRWVSAVVQENAGRWGDGIKRLETLEPPLPYMGIKLSEAIKAKNFSSKDQMTDNGAQTLAVIG